MIGRLPSPAPPRPQFESAGARAAESGFVLVGVVMFVLALTILGISLFGLSSYEAQFMQQSETENQAFFDAAGGIERAKFVLSNTGKLQDVQVNLPTGVVYSIARQNGATSGFVVWDPLKPITIRAAGAEGAVRCTIETTFKPLPVVDYYRRLVTSFGGITFNDQNQSSEPVRAQDHLFGKYWQQSADFSSWVGVGTVPTSAGISGAPAVPDIPLFLSDPAHFASGTPITRTAGPDYDFSAGSGVQLFSSAYNAVVDLVYSLKETRGSPSVAIKDTVIWMFDHGVDFKEGLIVSGSPGDCLVMIAHQAVSPPEPTLALNFEGGITASPGVAVILVADGKVDIEHYGQGLGGTDQLDYLSLYAGNVLVTGPHAGATLTWTHAPNDPRDQPGGLIDRLADLGYLPGQTGGTKGKLLTLFGSWRQTKSP